MNAAFKLVPGSRIAATMSATAERRKHWGWGSEGRQPSLADLEAMAPLVRERLGFDAQPPEEPVPLERAELAAPRVSPPDSLVGICADDAHSRATHALGKAYRDVVRGFRGRFDNPPDVVARPGTEAEVEAVLALVRRPGTGRDPLRRRHVGVRRDRAAAAARVPRRGLDRPRRRSTGCSRWTRSRARPGSRRARQARCSRTSSASRGLTMRCYPQSFEFSTLGGWIATRAGGHFATKLTHVDDMVESVRAITPAGEWESRRLPGSGAGPSPDRMLIGSEGILGVITEAWVRVQPRPTHRASCAVAFRSFAAGAEAVRELSQSGLDPANCRLLDAAEARFNGAGDGDALDAHARVRVGAPPGGRRPRGGARGGALSRRRAAAPSGPAMTRIGRRPAAPWRDAFLAAPYLRDSMVSLGVLSDTFETAITWDRLEEFHATVIEAARRAVGEPSLVTCRFTHVYPDGPAPYFTVLAPARRGSEVEQWDEIKAAVSDVLIDAGGTITHHHAVGRDHRPWYDRQRPEVASRRRSARPSAHWILRAC